MEDLFKKIDTLRERTGCTYEEAILALKKSDGDVAKALLFIESKDRTFTQKIEVASKDIIKVVKGLIKEGNITRIIIKNKDKKLVDIPVNAGVVGVVLLPYAAILAGISALATNCIIEIEKKEETIINVNEKLKNFTNEAEDNIKNSSKKAEKIFKKGLGRVEEVVNEAFDSIHNASNKFNK